MEFEGSSQIQMNRKLPRDETDEPTSVSIMNISVQQKVFKYKTPPRNNTY
jgi:hypothetical protein